MVYLSINAIETFERCKNGCTYQKSFRICTQIQPNPTSGNMTAPISQLNKEISQISLMKPNVLTDQAFNSRIRAYQELGLKAQKLVVENHELLLKGEVKTREIIQHILSAISTIEKDFNIIKWELKKTNEKIADISNRIADLKENYVDENLKQATC